MVTSFSRDVKPMLRDVMISNTCLTLRTIMRMQEQSRTAWLVELCLLAAHSGPQSSSVCTTSGGLTDISPD